MNIKQGLLFVLGGCVVAVPAIASDVTYDVQGTFNDGATFSGTFSYDPGADSYVDSSNPLGQYEITLQGGSPGYFPGAFAPGMFNADTGSQVDTSSSTPNDIVIGYGHSIFDTTLVLSWNNALNGPDGAAPQPITGGYELVSNTLCGVDCSMERLITSATLTPVPIPASAWLVFSGFGGICLLGRRRTTAKPIPTC